MNAEKLSDSGEFGFIERIQTHLPTRDGVVLGIGDDAAILQALQTPVVTCDALVQDVHFRLDWTSPRDLGWKTLAVNLSDIAAMGARPVAAFLSLAMPSNTELLWLDEFIAGLEAALQTFGCTLAGGDTTRSPHGLVISLTLIGESAPLSPLRRDGAQVGDDVLVTGTLGDSAAGLWCLQHENLLSRHLQVLADDAQSAIQITDIAAARNWLCQRHFRPTPRINEIALMRQIAPDALHAAIDISDGLGGDAAHIARRSGVVLQLLASEIPLSPALQLLSPIAAKLSQNTGQDWALHGGEDYELLLCVAPDSSAQIVRELQASGTRITRIGRVVGAQNESVQLIQSDGTACAIGGGYTHF